MAQNIFETLMGAVVLIVALGFVTIAYQGGKVKEIDGYSLNAKFERVDGLKIGSDVKVSGLTVGSIIKQTIDPKTYLAKIRISISDNVKLPNDSSAEILGDGLLGGKYLAIVPGGSEEMFKDGDEIQFTQSSISIESLIGKFMFGDAENGNEEKARDKSEDDIF